MESGLLPDASGGRFLLNNGLTIPAVGLGTWQGQFGTSQPRELIDCIVHALRGGYRLIDTAQYYGVEAQVGEAIRTCGIPREDIFVVSKYWGTHHGNPGDALEISLQALGLDYVDLFLMHWPTSANSDGSAQPYPGDPPYWKTWKNLEAIVGPKCRSIGICNVTQKTLSRLLQDADIVPAVAQVELHLLNPCLHLLPFCQQHNIHVMAYSTLGSERHGRPENPVLTNAAIQKISKAHGCSATAVALAWAVQRGATVIPKTSRVDRLAENVQFPRLSDDDINRLNEVHLNSGMMRLADITEGLLRQMPGKGTTILGWTPVDFGWEDDDGTWLT